MCLCVCVCVCVCVCLRIQPVKEHNITLFSIAGNQYPSQISSTSHHHMLHIIRDINNIIGINIRTFISCSLTNCCGVLIND